MKTALITTTINEPVNILKWGEQLSTGDLIIIAGDDKSPHEKIQLLLDDESIAHVDAYYTSSQSFWAVDDVIGRNSIQRRNIAILDALTHKPDVIFTVDDDNYPLGLGHVSQVSKMLSSGRQTLALPLISTDTGWFNPGSVLAPPVVHRGFPITLRRENHMIARNEPYDGPLAVHASLWLGDPDIDAIERIVSDPQVTSAPGGTFALHSDTWAPFNSQATAFANRFGALMCVWPGVGRMDDIWSYYVARHIIDAYGEYVAYGDPLVRQDRNPHNLAKDLQAEMLHYEFTEQFLINVRDVELDPALKPSVNLARVFARLTKCSFIPPLTVQFFTAWMDDINAINETYDTDY